MRWLQDNPHRYLDPCSAHQLIVQRLACHDFPFDMTRALELALFRTYCMPRISALLDRTGEFRQRPQKRYDDTDLLVSTLLEWGYASVPGARALARMSRIHGLFKIENADFLYVLSTFVFEPIRWIERFGWRKLMPQEKLALYYFWQAVGQRMGIQYIPASYEAFERYNREYEARHFTFAMSNQRIGLATRDMFAAWFPRWLRPLVRQAIHALLDEPVCSAFGFASARPGIKRLVTGALKLRAVILRLLPLRRRPRLRTQMRHRSYPEGYRLEHIGPAFLCPFGKPP